MMRTIVLMLLFLPVAAPVWARDSSPPWTKVQSPHFIVMTNASEKQARHVADQLERMRFIFHTLFPSATVDPGTPINVLALRDKRSFESLLPPDRLGKGQLELAGLFMTSPEKNYILLRLDAASEHPFDTVYHEYTHLQFRTGAEWIPIWFNEGIAEFFENTTIDNKNVLLGQPSVNDILYLRQQKLIPLKTLFTIDASSPYYHEEQKGSIFYAESWALTHYLMVTDKVEHTHRVVDYLTLMSQHIDSLTAGQKAFGDLDALERKLYDYVNHSDYKQFSMQADTRMDESGFTATPMAEPQADAIRADVLAMNGREADAKGLDTAVLQQDPNNTEALETMGFIAMQGGSHSDAADWYAKAVKADSQSYIANYEFAEANIQSFDPATSTQVETSLRTVIKLNPQFAPAYDQLAVFLAQHHPNPEEAHRLSVQAILLEPATLSYRFNAANVLAEQGSYSSAARVLDEAAKFAKSPQQLATIKEQADEMRKFAARQEPQPANHASETAHLESGSPAVEAPATQPQGNVRTEQANFTAKANEVIEDPKTHTLKIRKLTVLNQTKHPDEPATGPRHTAKGVIRSVSCSGTAGIDLRLEGGAKPVALYSNNYFKIDYSVLNFTPEGEIHPCQDLEGMKAKVEYAVSSDQTVDGQIVSIELSK